MFRQFKHLAMRLKARNASILSNIRFCRAKADAHEKQLQAPRYMIFFQKYRDYKRFVCKRYIVSLSLSLSLSLSKFANSLDPEDLRRLAKLNQVQTGYH